MKWIGVVALLLCLPAALLLGWVGFPLSPVLQGVGFHFIGHSHAGARAIPVSYGALAAAIILFAADARRRENFDQLYWAGLALTTLVAAAPLQVAFADPALLKRLADEADWAKAAMQFSLRSLPPNLGPEEETWGLLSLTTVTDRLSAGWYFMALGWYVTLAAGLATTIAGWTGPNTCSRLKLAAVAVAGVFVTCLAFMARPLLAQRTLIQAARAEGRGDAASAIRLYRDAMRMDGWLALSIDLHQRIGAIDASFGRTNTSEYLLYRAEWDAGQGQLTRAVTGYQRLAASGGELAPLAAGRAADLLREMGQHLYETGAFGAAVDVWQQCLAQDRSDWLSVYYLSRGYFAVGRYSEGATLARRSLAISDPMVRADLYSDLGDAQTKDGKLGDAHLAYWLSYELDYVLNRRGLAATTGP